MLAIPPTPTAAMSLWPAHDEERSRGCIAIPPPTHTSGATSSNNGPSIAPIAPIALSGTSQNMAKDIPTPATAAMIHPDGVGPPHARRILVQRHSQSKKASEQASSSSSRLGRFRLRVLAKQKDLYKLMTADTSQVADGRTPPPPTASEDTPRSADDGRLGTRSDGRDRLLPTTGAAYGGQGLSSSLNGRRPSSSQWSPIGVAEQQPDVASSLGPVPSLPFTAAAGKAPPPSHPDVTTRPRRSKPMGVGQSSKASSPLDRMMMESMECDRSLGLHDEDSSRPSSLDGGSSAPSSERPPPTTSSSVMIRRKSRPRHRSIPAEEVRGVLRRRPRYTRSASEPCVHPGVDGPEDSSNNGRRRRRSSMPYFSDPPGDIPKRLAGSSCSSLDYLGDGGSSDDDDRGSCDDDEDDHDHADKRHSNTSHDRASSWVPLGVDFSPSMEVYVFQKD